MSPELEVRSSLILGRRGKADRCGGMGGLNLEQRPMVDTIALLPRLSTDR